MDSLKRKAAIVGTGETPVGKVPGVSSMELHALAAKLALEDAGLAKADIDGVLTAGSMVDPILLHSSVFAEYLQIVPRFQLTMTIGGATHCAMVAHAAMAVEAGLCDYVLCVSADPQLSGLSRDKAVEMMAAVGEPQFESPYGPLIPGFYALVAQRHMYEYGTTSEQLAEIAVAQRRHASLNPKAQMREPITIQDVLNSKMISTPLHILDCALVSDGGGAVIVTTAERARDLKKPPIYLLGAGEGHTHENISQAPNLTTFGCKTSGEIAFRMAGLTPKDIDVAELYDCFTITVLIELEDLGFCRKGEGGAFVQGGRIALGGELPINTHGGLLSHAHPGVPGGIFHVIEAVRQLRGEAGERQVKDARIAVAHGNGGILSTHCTIILGRD